LTRAATPADAPAVAALLHAFNSEYGDFSPGEKELTRIYRELLEAGELTVLLADGGTGFAQVRLKRSHYTGLPDAHLEELYVVRRRRGEGIGRELLDAAMAAAREAGATHFELTTGEDDLAARALYEAAGFTNREGHPDGPRMLYYEREL
jgi:ribosomal protein S18 acetylase RimI-like enzyme